MAADRSATSSAESWWRWKAQRQIKNKDVIRILDAAVAPLGNAPQFIRADNGPEFVALVVGSSSADCDLLHRTRQPVPERLQREF